MCLLIFKLFWQCSLMNFFLENGILYFSLTSQEFITVEFFKNIFHYYWDMTTFVQKIPKILWKCTVTKKIQTQFFRNFSCLYAQITMTPSQYPLNKVFLFSWNCPFKKLFSSHKYVCVCLTMYSPLEEVYDFNKNITTLRVKMVKKTSRVRAIKRVRKTKKSPED